MNRLTLAGQVALIVASAIFLVQIFNLAIAVDHRRELALVQSVAPAAQRLLLVAERPDILERRAARDERSVQRGRPLRERRDRFLRPRMVTADPLPADAIRLERAEAVLRARFDDAGIETMAVRVGLAEANPRAHRAPMILAVQIGPEEWITLRAPGPPSMRPLVSMLLLQSLLIGLAILVPTLLVLRRVGGSLTRLKEAARDFDGASPGAPVPATGPRDVASMIEAVNAMQARLATMLSEKDVMLGAIGHDLRTPLTALRIEAETVEDEERRAALVTQVERLHAQFEAILDLARSSRPLAPGQVVDVASLLDRVAASYGGRPVTVHPGGHASFPGDPVAVERALSNLIDNALRHGNRVDVRAELGDDQVVFRVEDDGPGIPAGDRERMVRPFERGDGSRNRDTGGDGLGLAIVAAIMRRHRGALDLSSREDGGPGLVASLAFPLLSGSAQTLH